MTAQTLPALQHQYGHELTESQAASIRDTFANATAENTSRSYRADLADFTAWNGEPVAFPIPAARLMAYLTDRKATLSAPTLGRRVAGLSVAHRLQGIGHEQNPCRHSSVTAYLAAIRREAAKAGRGQHKAPALTLDLVERLLDSIGQDWDLAAIRDSALIAVAFASGGRRRSEIAALQVADVEPVKGGYLLQIRRSKTDQQGKGLSVPVRGRAATLLGKWISALAERGVVSGSLFRGVNRWGQVNGTMGGQSINRMIQARASDAGLPGDWSAHSLRSGYVTSAALAGVSLPEAMQLSGHKSVVVASGYFRGGAVMVSKAGGLME